MKTQFFTAASLDGFLATEDDSVDWLEAQGEPTESSYPEFIADVGALAMGSGTYEWVLRYMREAQDDAGRAWPYTLPAWVFSSRELPRAEGADLHFVRGDVRPVHAAMSASAGGKNLWVVGGGDLVGQFHDAGLLDELIVTIASATLGSGKPLLPRRIVGPLALTSARALGPGFVELRYDVRRGGRARARRRAR